MSKSRPLFLTYPTLCPKFKDLSLFLKNCFATHYYKGKWPRYDTDLNLLIFHFGAVRSLDYFFSILNSGSLRPLQLAVLSDLFIANVYVGFDDFPLLNKHSNFRISAPSLIILIAPS